MKYLVLILAFSSVALAQFENGFVKILQDKRYQEGAAFGNYRDQEDGIKYQEETDGLGIRRGFWEYPDETGKLLRVEFEAGPGIGFRIVNSNFLAPSLVDNKIAKPAVAPKPVVKQAPVKPFVPQPAPRPVVHRAPLPVVRAAIPTTTPHPVALNLFDYPANLDFSRHAGGHTFKFTAV